MFKLICERSGKKDSVEYTTNLTQANRGKNRCRDTHTHTATDLGTWNTDCQKSQAATALFL